MAKVLGIVWALVVAACAGVVGLGFGALFHPRPEPIVTGIGFFFGILGWIIYRRWAKTFLP